MTKSSQVNCRKIYEILDQFDKSIKSYIKMFEAAGLLSLPIAQVGSNILTISDKIFETNFTFHLKWRTARKI